MGGDRLHRKILVVGAEASIRSLIHTILSRLGCEAEMVESGQEALARIGRGDFGAVLLDLKCSDLDPAAVVSQIYELSPRLAGQILVLTADVIDEATMELIEEHYLLSVRRKNIRDELGGRLRALFRIPPAFNHAA